MFLLHIEYSWVMTTDDDQFFLGRYRRLTTEFRLLTTKFPFVLVIFIVVIQDINIEHEKFSNSYQ